eukprot:COSAG02_NODE_52691_length_306_cov_0.797101_1_plen_38_part_10
MPPDLIEGAPHQETCEDEDKVGREVEQQKQEQFINRDE